MSARSGGPVVLTVSSPGGTGDEPGGIAVDAHLQTSASGIYAAGDVAEYESVVHGGRRVRIEHWDVAFNHGKTAALNMLGHRETFVAVPFFWRQHYDVPINYIGHAEKWDEIAIDGDVMAKDCLLRYKLNGRVLAAAAIYRDLDLLKAEVAMEGE